MKKAIVLFALASLGAASQAIIVGPGSSLATAASISRGPVIWADAGLMNLSAGGTHWWKISLTAGETLTLITTPLPSPFFAPDTVMAVFDGSSTTALVKNDDGGNGFGSAVRWTATYNGDHYIAVVGYTSGDQTDQAFYDSSSSTESGQYVLTASIVPEPSSMIALGLGAVAFVARRRRK